MVEEEEEEEGTHCRSAGTARTVQSTPLHVLLLFAEAEGLRLSAGWVGVCVTHRQNVCACVCVRGWIHTHTTMTRWLINTTAAHPFLELRRRQ